MRDVVCFIETDGDGNGEGWRPNQMYSRDPCIEIYKCPHGYNLLMYVLYFEQVMHLMP